MRRLVALLTLGWLLPTLAGSAVAAVAVSGSFIAHDTCPAYVSKNKQTNPGDVRLQAKRDYPIREANKTQAPDWLRIDITEAQPSLRWVSIDCGTHTLSPSPSQTSAAPAKTKAACNTPDLADSYVLALSWQPAFCQDNRDKAECRREPVDHGISLHGLWPNKQSCGIKYGFCGDYQQVQRPFCDYSALTLSSGTRQQLDAVMPSAKAGSCLQRHQWHKHGSCQTQWSQDQYFALASRLTHEFGQGPVGALIRQHQGRHLDKSTLLQAIDQHYGPGSRQRTSLICKGKMLVEIRLQLPSTLSANDTLARALANATPASNDRCDSRLYIDAPGP